MVASSRSPRKGKSLPSNSITPAQGILVPAMQISSGHPCRMQMRRLVVSDSLAGGKQQASEYMRSGRTRRRCPLGDGSGLGRVRERATTGGCRVEAVDAGSRPGQRRTERTINYPKVSSMDGLLSADCLPDCVVPWRSVWTHATGFGKSE
jgi:hypothetical protein